MPVRVGRAQPRRGQPAHRAQQCRACPAVRRRGHGRHLGRAGQAAQRGKPLAQRRVGDAEQPAQLVPGAAGRDQPRGAGQHRRQARRVGQRPVGRQGHFRAPGILPLAQAPPHRPPSLHRCEVAQRSRQPGQHPVVAEVAPTRGQRSQAGGLHQVFGLVRAPSMAPGDRQEAVVGNARASHHSCALRSRSSSRRRASDSVTVMVR